MKLGYLTVTVIGLLVQPIYSFCIYNRMDGGINFTVAQNIHGVSGYKIFSKTMKPGDIECCHFSNTDCSPKGTDNEPAEFTFKLLSRKGSKESFNVVCKTGGAIALYGNEDNANATCTTADGTTNPTPLV